MTANDSGLCTPFKANPYDTSALPLINSVSLLIVRELLSIKTGKLVYNNLRMPLQLNT